MENLHSWLQKINLLFTNTLKQDDFYQKNFDANKIELKKDNCISIYNLIEAFNKMYVAFQKDYAKLKKMDLGKDIYITSFYDYEDGKKEGSLLEIEITEPNKLISSRTRVNLFLREENNKYTSFIASNLYIDIHSPSAYYEELDLEEQDIKRYMNFFKKHRLLFELYNYLRFRYIYEDGTNIIQSYITSNKEDNLLYGLDTFKIYISTTYASYIQEFRNKVETTFKLGEDLAIKDNDFKLELYNEKINVNKEEVINILKGLYLNGEYLTWYVNRRNKELIKKQIKSLEKENESSK